MLYFFPLSIQVTLFYVVRISLASLCALVEAFFYRTIVSELSAKIGLYTLVLLVTSHGMFLASSAFLPSSFTMIGTMLALSFWMKINGQSTSSKLEKSKFKWYFGLVCSVCASVVLGWPFSAAIGVPIIIDLLILRASKQAYYDFILSCVLAVLIIMVNLRI